MGLLDDFSSFIKTPEGIGLLSAAFGGMSGAKRGTPWNNLGRGGVAGLMGYAGAQEHEMKLAQEAEAKRLRDLQIQTAQLGIDKAKGEAEWAANLPKVMSPKPVMPGELGSSSQEVDQQAFQNHLLGQYSPVRDKILESKFAAKENKTFAGSEFGMYIQDPSAPGGVRQIVAPAAKVRALPEGMMIGDDGSLKTIPGYVEMKKEIAAAGRATHQPAQPYYSPVVDATRGIGTFNHRTGTMQWGNGSPVIKPSDSPSLQGAIAAAKGAGTEGGKTGIEINTKLHETASKSAQALPKVNELITLLETGDINTGLGAEIFLGINRAIALLGGEKGARKATDTQIADVLMGSEVFPLISSLGIGAKGMDTPPEREFMRKMLTGEIPLERGTLLHMAKMRRDSFQGSINTYNRKVDSGEMDIFFKTTQIKKSRIGDQAASDKRVTMDDIQATAKSSRKSTQEVTAAFKAKGYVIEGQ